jgi:Rgg/GadR/MutR family transcriptional activator
MKAYGETLRQIREQKGLTMKELAEGICSISFLSKFERGESDISLGLLTGILEKLMISFDEYLYIHNEYKLDKLEQFFKDVNTAYYESNSDHLNKLKRQEMKKWEKLKIPTYYYNVLMIEVLESIVNQKAIDQEIDQEGIHLLSDYLFRIEVWGYYEFMLYNATMLFLNPDTVVQLSRTAYEKSIRYRMLPKVNTTTATIMMNTITKLVGPVNHFNKRLEFPAEISEFFSYLEKLAIPENHLFERVNLLHLQGTYEIKCGNKETGIKKFQQAIQILTDLGSFGHAKRIEDYMQQILEHL